MRISRPTDIIRDVAGLNEGMRWSQVNMGRRRVPTLSFTHEIGRPGEPQFAEHDDSESAQRWYNTYDLNLQQQNLLPVAGITPSFEKQEDSGWIEIATSGGTLSDRSTINSLRGSKSVARTTDWQASDSFSGRIKGKTRFDRQAVGFATDVRTHPIKLTAGQHYSWRLEMNARQAPLPLSSTIDRSSGGVVRGAVQSDAWLRYWNDDFTRYIDSEQITTWLFPLDGPEVLILEEGDQAQPGFTNAQIVVTFDSVYNTLAQAPGEVAAQLPVPKGTPYDIFLDAAMVVDAFTLGTTDYWDDIPLDVTYVQKASFYRDPKGFVYLRGNVSSQYGSSLERDMTIFTLPEGFRPEYEQLFPAVPIVFEYLIFGTGFGANLTAGDRVIDTSPSTLGGSPASQSVGSVIRSTNPADALPGQLTAISAPDHDHLLLNAAPTQTVGASLFGDPPLSFTGPSVVRIKPNGDVLSEGTAYYGRVLRLILDGISFYSPQPPP